MDSSQPSLHHVRVDGLKIAYFEWKGLGSGPETLLFVHGAACHARCWDATIESIDAGYRVIAIELRGHGRSENRGPYGWDQFATDTCTAIEQLDLTSVVVVGHSLGGHLALQVAAKLGPRISALVLVDPTVFDPRAYRLGKEARLFDAPSDHPVAERRSRWNSPAEWFDALRDRNPFKLWDLDILWTHCQHGLTETATGKFELCCPPLVEAETYLGTADTDIYPLLPLIDIPVTILRARLAPGMRHPLDSVHSLTWPKLSTKLANAKDYYLPDLSHYIPMQRPKVVADAIREVMP